MPEEEALLPRVISIIPVHHGEVSRTKNFEPDYRYTEHFLDLQYFDEVVFINVEHGTRGISAAFARFITQIYPQCFLPVTIGGGVSSVKDAEELFALGADRILVGSSAFSDPQVVRDCVERWGSQAVVGGISLKRFNGEPMAVRSDRTSVPEMTAREAVALVQELGVGEVLLNSVDRDGSLSGYDQEAFGEVLKEISVPTVLAGGAGNWGHLLWGIRSAGVAGVATSNIYHLTSGAILAAKAFLAENGVPVRSVQQEPEDYFL